MVTEGMEVRSVGNTLTLHETALVEAFTRITDANSRSAVVAIARILAGSLPPASADKTNLSRQGQ